MTNTRAATIPRVNPFAAPAGYRPSTRHTAPIPLYVEVDEIFKTSQKAGETIKGKLRRNPSSTTSPQYEKSFRPWDGTTLESYCELRVMQDDYIKNCPLSSTSAKFQGTEQILTGNAKEAWLNQLDNLEDALKDTEEGWTNVQEAFAKNYGEEDAGQKQKRRRRT